MEENEDEPDDHMVTEEIEPREQQTPETRHWVPMEHNGTHLMVAGDEEIYLVEMLVIIEVVEVEIFDLLLD